MDKFAENNNPQVWHGQAGLAQLRGWLGQTRRCPACGRNHTIRTRMLEAAPDMARKVSQYLGSLGFRGRCAVVMDENTAAAAGEKLLEGLSAYRPKAIRLQSSGLHSDELGVGTVLLEMEEKPDFFVACGSGTITDLTRFAATVTGLPFVSFATAASVDGFASSTAAMLSGGYKQTYQGVAPEAILYDPAVLARAPQRLTAAGFGDVAGKIVALLDWRLAYVLEDEPYCPLIAAMVDRAVQEVLSIAADLKATPERIITRAPFGEPAADQIDFEQRSRACGRLMDALSLTGLAMQMMDTSRPASGAEHQISHLLEMRDIRLHREGSLHGDKVGIGTLIGMTLYLCLFSGGKMPEQRPILPASRWEAQVRRVYGTLAEKALAINEPEPPQGAEWARQKKLLAQAMDQFGFAMVHQFRTLMPRLRDQIAALGGPVRPEDLGYTPEETYDAIAFGKENRPKFTILRLAERYGQLYDLAREIADGLPKGHIY